MSLIVKIQKDFGSFKLDIDFSSETKNVAFLGKSGSGKSLTLKCIAGIIKPDRGYIELNGRILFDSEKHINVPTQKRKVGYLFQNYALFPNMTVRKNIELGYHGPKEKKAKEVNKYLSLFQLEAVAKNHPSEISGGEAQRTALARILISNPEILLLDEPFSALDAFLRNRLQMEMKNILSKYDGQAILVTHDRDEAYLLSEDVALVNSGKILITKNTKELFKCPEYYEAAKLTGCKNFSKVAQLSPKKIKCLDWGIELSFKDVIPAGINYIGIRAHDFSLPLRGGYEINVIDISEEPFENLIRFRFANQNSESEDIFFKIKKDVPLKEAIQRISFSLDDVLFLR